MKISRIRWQNFRPFNTEIQLEPEEQVVLVNWVNGTGKTSFLNSIAWCVTGEEIFTSARYLPNGAAVKAAYESTSELLVEVEIEFLDNLGARSIVQRQQSFRATSIDEVIETRGATVSVQIEELERGFSSLSSTESAQWLQENFPRELVENFLVNGQKWGSDRQSKKGAVEAIARIDAFTRVISHLEGVERELSEEAKPRKSAPQAKIRLGEELDTVQRNLDVLNQQLIDASVALDEFEKQNGPLDEWWAKISEGSELKAKVSGLQDRIKSADSSKNDALQELSGSLAEDIPSALLRDQVDSLRNHLSEAGKTNAPSWLIEQILQTGQCLCGRESHSVSDFISSASQSNEQSALVELFALSGDEVESTARAGIMAHGRMIEQFKQLRSSSDDIETLREELETAIGNRSVKDVQSAENVQTASAVYVKLKAHQTTLESAPGKVLELEDKKKTLSERLQSDNEGLSASAIKAKEQAIFARECLEIARAIRAETIHGVRQKVQEEFERIYRAISSDREESWAKFELDEHFDIKIIDKDGQDRRTGFSAGRELSLAFAFALALGKIAGYELPLIADTPFGPLSRELKLSTVGGIRNEIGMGGASEDRQMFLLMHDEEFSPAVQQAFEELRPTIFHGSYDEDTQTTSIVRAKRK